MTKKKGKLMTFLWSLIPGAGEMYLGFFKTGVSLMAAFVLLLSLAGFLQLNVLSLLAPVVWFYSFFHSNHINALPDDEFYALDVYKRQLCRCLRSHTGIYRQDGCLCQGAGGRVPPLLHSGRRYPGLQSGKDLPQRVDYR